METKAISIKQSDDFIDPIGVELILSILSLAVGIFSAAHQFGPFINREKQLISKFKKLKGKTLRLHNCLDDFILTVQRHSHYGIPIKKSLVDKTLTLSETLFQLKEKDYYRWLDIKDTVYKLSQEVYSLISEIRAISHDIPEQHDYMDLNKYVFASFDNLLVNFASYKLGDFISELRKTISVLEDFLSDLIQNKKEKHK